jgi:hypothetical protein
LTWFGGREGSLGGGGLRGWRGRPRGGGGILGGGGGAGGCPTLGAHMTEFFALHMSVNDQLIIIMADKHILTFQHFGRWWRLRPPGGAEAPVACRNLAARSATNFMVWF